MGEQGGERVDRKGMKGEKGNDANYSDLAQ